MPARRPQSRDRDPSAPQTENKNINLDTVNEMLEETPAATRRGRRAKTPADATPAMPTRRSARISSRAANSEKPVSPQPETLPFPPPAPPPTLATVKSSTTASKAPSVYHPSKNDRVDDDNDDDGKQPARDDTIVTQTVLLTRSGATSAAPSARSRHSARSRVPRSSVPKMTPVLEAPTVSATSKQPDRSTSGWFRFPLVVASSLVLNTVIYTGLDYSGILGTDLARVSQQPADSWPVGVVLGWRLAELAISWIAGFDDFDVASLTILTHLPHLLFLNTFYRLPVGPLAWILATDVVSSTLPFAIARTRSAAHSFTLDPDSSMPRLRRNIIADPTTAVVTISFAAFVYAISLVTSYRLPVLLPYLAFSFDGLDTFEIAHEWAASPAFGPRSIPALAATLLPLGFAARALLFTPAATIPPAHAAGDIIPAEKTEDADETETETAVATFNPVTASLGETIRHNLAPPAAVTDTRTRVLVFRTLVVVAVGLANAAIRTGGTVRGGEVYGGLAWGTVWAIANVLVSAVFWWVGHV